MTTNTDTDPDYAVLGVGSIAEAIVSGLCAARPGRDIVLSPRGADRAQRLARLHPEVRVADDNQQAIEAAGTVLVCLRAADAAKVLGALAFGADQQVISVMPAPQLDDLAHLVAPATKVSRAIPALSVAERTGLTPVYPAFSAAQTLFDQLGSTMALDAEHLLDAASVASATVASWFAYLQQIAGWLAGQGVEAAQAQRLVGAVFAGAAADLAHSADFGTLAAQHATPGGQNERLLLALRRAGVFDAVSDGLDALLKA